MNRLAAQSNLHHPFAFKEAEALFFASPIRAVLFVA